jgi:hypothetical protein
MAYSKLALIRDQTVPIGQSAPMHIECKCTNHVNIESDRNNCTCGAVYDARGYVVVASAASNTEVADRYL